MSLVRFLGLGCLASAVWDPMVLGVLGFWGYRVYLYRPGNKTIFYLPVSLNSKEPHTLINKEES